MGRYVVLVVIALLAAACSPAATPTDDPAGETGVTQTTSVDHADTSTTVPDGPKDFCVTGDLPFVDSGLAAAIGEDVGDATQIEQIRMEQAPTCERITIEFTNGNGAPATSLGPTGVTVLEFVGLIRIGVPPDVVSTAIADTLLEGEFIESATVVRDETGTLSIDIRATDGTPILARAFVTASPAALVIDVATSPDLPTPAGVTASTPAVVVAPVAGPGLYPLSVEGYAAPGLRSIRIQLGTEDTTDVDLSIALTGGTDAWQAFHSSIVDGPPGPATLFVGTADSNGQPLDGARVSLDLP